MKKTRFSECSVMVSKHCEEYCLKLAARNRRINTLISYRFMDCGSYSKAKGCHPDAMRILISRGRIDWLEF